MAIEVGTQVKLLPTSDPDIDRYAGQVGTVVKIEPSFHTKRTGEDWDHYFVQMNVAKIVCISVVEFEVVKEQSA